MQPGNEAQNVDFIGKLTNFREEGGNEGIWAERRPRKGLTESGVEQEQNREDGELPQMGADF
jgi:hypothetical protein